MVQLALKCLKYKPISSHAHAHPYIQFNIADVGVRTRACVCVRTKCEKSIQHRIHAIKFVAHTPP